MTYAPARAIAPAEIPIIDLTALSTGMAGELQVGATLLKTVQQVGFFYVSHHGIDPKLIDEVFAASERFYRHPVEQRMQVRVQGYHRGYIPLGEANMPGVKTVDLKESFVWGLDVSPEDPDIEPSGGLIAPNRWPGFMPELKGLVNTFFEQANGLGKSLLRAFAASLELPHDFFTRCFSKPTTRGALLHYPPQPAQMGAEQFGVGPHTDYGCLTLLCQDPCGGLQVQHRDGTWVTAHPVPGTLVVNVGDLLHRWSNNQFLSNPHRVINASGKTRFSIPVFVDPDWDTLIAPVAAEGEAPHYPPVVCADYIRQRYQQAFAYQKK